MHFHPHMSQVNRGAGRPISGTSASKRGKSKMRLVSKTWHLLNVCSFRRKKKKKGKCSTTSARGSEKNSTLSAERKLSGLGIALALDVLAPDR